MGHRLAIVLVLVLALAPATMVAQTVEAPRPVAWDVARAVLVDPTTYAPALIGHEAMTHDWKTSQVLFRHGWVESNPRFTKSGLPNDVPVSYSTGSGIIHREAFKLLGYSAMNNVAMGIGERLLIVRYPSRRKLIRTLGWVERIGYASFLAYRNSADHFRQAGKNQRLARDLGYSP